MTFKLYNRLGDCTYDMVSDTDSKYHVLVTHTRGYFSEQWFMISNKGEVAQSTKASIMSSMKKTVQPYFFHIPASQYPKWIRKGQAVIEENPDSQFAAAYAKWILLNISMRAKNEFQTWFGFCVCLLPIALPEMEQNDLYHLFQCRHDALSDFAMTLWVHPESAVRFFKEKEDAATILKEMILPHCKQFIAFNRWDSADPRVRAFLNSDTCDEYPTAVEDRILSEFSGVGLPYSIVANKFVFSGKFDEFYRYLSESEKALSESFDDPFLPYPALLACFSESGHPDLCRDLAIRLICATRDSGCYLYLSEFLGKDTINDLASHGKLAPIVIYQSHDTTIHTDLFKLSQKSFRFSIPKWETVPFHYNWSNIDAVYAFPHLTAQLQGLDDSYEKRSVRERIKEEEFRSSGSEDESNLYPIRSDALFLASLGDSSPIRYITEDYFGTEDLYPPSMAFRMRLCKTMGKRITFAQPYGGKADSDPAVKPAATGAKRGRKKKTV